MTRSATDYRQRLQAFFNAERAPIRAELPNPAVDDRTASIRLYDVIDSYGGYWGVSAREFAAALDELPDSVEEIRLLINSPGGEVWEGLAILNMLRAHKARVVAVVQGMAASAASFIAAGVDELEMAPNSELFVHCAWGLCVGNAADMQKMADDLAHEDRNIASIYAAKAGGAIDEWMEAMTAESFYSAEEAVEAGLADRVGSTPVDDDAKNRWDRSILNFAGRQAPKNSATPPSPSPAPGQEGGSVSDLTDLREALELAENASDDEILAAALDKLTAPAPEPASLPEGVVTIDASQLEQLRGDAAAGREAREAQITARREQLVDAAILDGRIAPARRDAWLAQLAADAGAETVLASLEKGVIPVTQKGHGGDVDLDSDDALWARIFKEPANG